MYEYPKISSLFERSTTGTRKLIEGAYRNPLVEYLKDNTWQFTEKIDGTNIGIVWDGHTVSYQGRTERSQIPAHLFSKLSQLFSGNDAEELFEQLFGVETAILYGEGYGAKIQNGSLYRSDVSFALFDIFIPSKNLWYKRDAVENIAHTFNIDVVPIVLEGTIADGVAFVKTNPASTIGNAKMEGVVGKPKIDCFDRDGNRVIVKIKSVDFA